MSTTKTKESKEWPTTTAFASERLNLRIATVVEKLAEQEAAILGMTRNHFLRNLVQRRMGKIHMARPTEAPKRTPLRAVEHEMVNVGFNLDPESLKYLHDLANRCGNVSRSAVLSMMILEWAGIRPELIAPDAR